MKRRIAWTFSVFVAVLLSYFLTPHKERSMKLVHNTTGFAIIECRGGQILFKDRFLEKEMKLHGIAIPPPLQPQYQGKSSVHIEDKDFSKAFKEVYCNYVLTPSDYHWE